MMVLGVFAYQFWRVGGRLDWSAFGAALATPARLQYLLLALALMPVNWLLEARKWQLLMRPFHAWDFGKTLRATLAGVSLSAATPNRVGEIGGRLLYVTKAQAPAVLTTSVIGSACQWIAFLLLAWPGLLWTAGDLLITDTATKDLARSQVQGGGAVPRPLEEQWWLNGVLPFGTDEPGHLLYGLALLGPLALLLAAWAGKPLLIRLIRGLGRWFGRPVEELLAGLAGVKSGLILRAGSYACLRFVVYCTQLYLLLRFFGLALPYFPTLAGIMGIYLVQAGIPLPPGVNLIARAELGLLIWGDDPATSVATVMAFTGLFAVNVLLPALPGYWLLIKKR